MDPMGSDRPSGPTRAELRWFGLLLLVFFGLVGGIVFWQTGSVRATGVLLGLGLVLATTYYLIRPLRVPLYRSWMALAMPLGWLVSNVALGLIYFLIVTPLGRAMALFGRDKLGRSFDRSAASYWTERDRIDEPARYLRQS